MHNTEYKRWWDLHLRTCRGEELSDEERAVYEAGRQELQDEEHVATDLTSLRQTRQEVMELDVKCDQLQARRRQLKQEISRLESALSVETRKALGIQD